MTAGCRTALVLAALAVRAGAAEAPRVIPAKVEMGALYSGTTVRVEGTAAPGAQVIIAVRGGAKDEVFNRKRQFGPIWISSGRVHVKGVPSLWMVLSGVPAARILPRETVNRLALDGAAIESHIQFEPEESDLAILRRHYLAWKRQQGLYWEDSSRVRMAQADGATGRANWSVEFLWPRTAPPGRYRVVVYECRQNAVAEFVEVSLEAVKVGLPRRVADAAANRAGLYGILCILIAAAAGFGMDRIVTLLGGTRLGGH